MTESQFIELISEIVTIPNAEACWRKLAPSFEKVDSLADAARYVHAQWLAGELTKRNGIDQLKKAVNSLGY